MDMSERLLPFAGLYEHIEDNTDWWKDFMNSPKPLNYLKDSVEGKLSSQGIFLR